MKNEISKQDYKKIRELMHLSKKYHNEIENLERAACKILEIKFPDDWVFDLIWNFYKEPKELDVLLNNLNIKVK